MEALFDASEEDAATGGADPLRGIYPSVFVVTAEGVAEVPDDDVRQAYESVVAGRERTP